MRSRTSRTFTSASRVLFCGTTSPSCGTTRNLKSRGPDSVATARTRTVAGDPSTGSSAFSEPMIRPSSSTSTVTVRPEKPVCATTTSTSSEASLSTVRGTVTRSTWMSRWSASPPTPTANTGSFSAFRPSNACDSDDSLVSAPSDTSTTPATGRPASSSRTPSKAAPSLVCDPLKVSSLADCTREAAEEKRNTRTRKRSPSDLSSGEVAAPNSSCTYWPRGFPATSGICMLAESSSSTATTFCWFTAARTISVGRNRQKRTMPSTARRRTVRMTRSRGRPWVTWTRR